MKKIIYVLITGLFISFSINLNAQGLLRRLTDRAMETVIEKTEEEAAEEMEEEIDERMEEEENNEPASDESDNSESFQNIMNRFGMDTTPVEYEDSYSFSSNVKMELENYKSNGSLDAINHFNTYYDINDQNFAYEILNEDNQQTGEGFFIYDTKNNVSIILSEQDGEKRGIATRMEFSLEEIPEDFDLQEYDNDLSVLYDNLTKTGRSKNIQGYNCEEYVYEDELIRSQLWITNEKFWQTKKIISAFYNSSQYASGYPAGGIMEMENENLESHEKTIMKVTEINENINKEIDLVAYDIMNMGSFNIDMPQE